MFLIAFALGLREIERDDDGRVAILIGLALISAAMVPVYSFPGLSWLGITARALGARPSGPRADGGRPAGVRQAVRALAADRGPGRRSSWSSSG